MKNTVLYGDCRKSLEMLALENITVNMCVTSPPYYGLRDYGAEGQIGLENTPDIYINNLVHVFSLVRNILSEDGTLWVNIGDSYNGSGGAGYQFGDPKKPRIEHFDNPNKNVYGLKPKDLIGIPWMLAFALRKDGWYLRQDIIWHKPNPMPEPVEDRCTKSHEYIFLLSKNKKYYYDYKSIQEKSVSFENRLMGVQRERIYGYDSKQHKMGKYKTVKGSMNEDGVTRYQSGLNIKTPEEKTSEFRNRRSVWTVATKPYTGSHFAVFPGELIEPCILAGSRAGGTVLDPFFGSGTTGEVCERLGRNWIGCELNEQYSKLHHERTAQVGIKF